MGYPMGLYFLYYTGRASCSACAIFRFIIRIIGMANTIVRMSATACTVAIPYAPNTHARGYRIGIKQVPCRAVASARAPLP